MTGSSEHERERPLLRLALFIGIFAALRACIPDDDGVIPVSNPPSPAGQYD